LLLSLVSTDLRMAWLCHYKFPVNKFWLAAVSVLGCCSWLWLAIIIMSVGCCGTSWDCSIYYKT